MESIELLPLIKAYPALSRTYGEVCCVAGTQMTDAGPRWIRLYPVPFRVLEDHRQFRKYQRGRQLRELEQIPYSFKYRYRCDDGDCDGHWWPPRLPEQLELADLGHI